MKLGVCLPHYGMPIEPAALKQFVQRTEELLFDSVWVTDHIIVPRDLEIVYKDRMLDPLATLSYLTGITERISLGTSVIILPYRNPIALAKTLASIDVLSNGRVIFGAASGWMEGEFRALNADFDNRGAISDENIQVIRELWTQTEPKFHGANYELSNVIFSPMPVQVPHPPIWIGGRSKRAIRRAVELGEGWHPNLMPANELRKSVKYMDILSRRKGRSAPPLLSARASVDFDKKPGQTRAILCGSNEEIAQLINDYAGIGVMHLIISFSELTMDRQLTNLERFADKVIPLIR